MSGGGQQTQMQMGQNPFQSSQRSDGMKFGDPQAEIMYDAMQFGLLPMPSTDINMSQRYAGGSGSAMEAMQGINFDGLSRTIELLKGLEQAPTTPSLSGQDLLSRAVGGVR